MRRFRACHAVLTTLLAELTIAPALLAQDAAAPPAAPPPPAAEGTPTPPEPDGESSAEEAAEAGAEGGGEPADPEAEAAAAEAEAAAAEAEMEAEMAAERPDRPAPKGKGVIWGVVKDQAGDTVIEGSVSVPGTAYKTITDIDGRFRLELPPGTYSLRFYYELHRPARLNQLTVAEGQVLNVETVQLEGDEDAIDTVEVETEVTKSTIEGQILARQRSAAVGDSVGRAEIAKTPDRNAAQAAQRVVGATVVGNRFVYVRGLGERYTNSLLNGAPLPSPEPDRAAVPLDLFPTLVLDSITIAKTFTPDVPGDFAGGSVRIETREIPSQFLFQASLTGGVNTQSTFSDRQTYRGGSLDWLGIDDGTRGLPDGTPRFKLIEGGVKPGGAVTEEDTARAGRRINSYMSTKKAFTPPDQGMSLIAGNGWDFGEGRKLGVLAALNYSRGYTQRDGAELNQYGADATSDTGYIVNRAYSLPESDTTTVNWGAFASVSYRFAPEHRLTLVGIRTTLNDDTTQVLTGFHRGRNQDIYATRFSFVTRALNMLQLRGDHDFPSLGGATLNWNLAGSTATRYEPDTRQTVWGRSPDGGEFRYTDDPNSGQHFFADQSEDQFGGGLDWTQPLNESKTESKLKFGALVSLRDRKFESRNFALRRNGGANQPLLRCESGNINDCNDALFLNPNIAEDGPLRLEESTTVADAYDASLDILAGYLMTDLSLTKSFRVIAGERIEYTNQSIDPYDQFGLEPAPQRAQIKQTDLLPVIAGVLDTSDKTKLRASVTRTLARPQLRELAPFAFTDFFGGRVTSGNPDLEITRITNADIRFEYFPTLREVLAASLFFKSFADPIEPIIKSSGDEGLLTYANAEGANLVGIELEARKELSSLTPVLKDFSVVTNLTLAHSEIEIEKTGALNLTNTKRPLVNQAPYVFNLSLEYSSEPMGLAVRALYNLVGPRIAEVGTDGLDDAYLHTRGFIDLTAQQKLGKHFDLKISGKNLLNSEYLVTQGCGSDGAFGGTWHLGCSEEDAVVYRYKDGASVSLTGTYTY